LGEVGHGEVLYEDTAGGGVGVVEK
jgi:hypothetical protein